MEKAKILRLMFLVFLMFRTAVFGSPIGPLTPYANRPLCQSQFMLVNHACATLPFNPNPGPSRPDLPAISPPSPDAPDSEGGSDVGTHGHRHHRRHQEHAEHALSPIEQECCRWLNAVDDECICDILVHLPAFLSRPVHEYIVQPYGSCRVSFSCGSRLHI